MQVKTAQSQWRRSKTTQADDQHNVEELKDYVNAIHPE